MADAMPSLTDFSISQTIDVSSGTADLKLTAVADDDDGISRVVFYFDRDVSYSFGPGSNGSIRSGWEDFSSGYSYTVTDSTLSGTVNISQIWVYDSTGNVTRYSQSELQQLGFDTNFEIVGGRSNDAATGSVTISGSAFEDQTLTLSSTVADEDGIDADSVSYQWLRDGSAISGATGTSYILIQDDVGAVITAEQSYTDYFGNKHIVTSSATSSISNINDAPTGSVTITGTAAEDQTLTLNSSVADEHGIDADTVSYQWYRDGSSISDATNTSYTLTQDDVGANISASVSYTDGYGIIESVTSAATSAVSNVNDAPTGSVTITGTAAEDQTLTLSYTVVDEDGIDADTVSLSMAA